MAIIELRNASNRGVYCPPLKLHFPPLCRVVQSLSRRQLDELGMTDEEPIENYVHYTLADEKTQNERYPGIVDRGVILGISDRKAPSFFIRRHTDEQHAFGYLRAIQDVTSDDSDEDDDGSELCRSSAGIFTLVPRTHRKNWPSPLVIYATEYPTNNIAGSEQWAVAFGPDDQTIYLPDYKIPDLGFS